MMPTARRRKIALRNVLARNPVAFAITCLNFESVLAQLAREARFRSRPAPVYAGHPPDPLTRPLRELTDPRLYFRSRRIRNDCL
ncbi:hypothetical protein [Pararhizobium sp.]|uniref:hypothetical protein n=1 Tax=Pararhizobium sp. TaxID=1977563 RepID=UPI003D0FEB00